MAVGIVPFSGTDLPEPAKGAKEIVVAVILCME